MEQKNTFSIVLENGEKVSKTFDTNSIDLREIVKLLRSAK